MPSGGLSERDDLVDEVRPEADVLDAHHRDGVVEMVDPARERRRLGIDEEPDRHHPEHAAALGERLELPVGEVPGVVEDGAAARMREGEGDPFVDDVAPGLLGRMRQVKDDPELREPADERAAAVAQSLLGRLDAAGELVRMVPAQAR